MHATARLRLPDGSEATAGPGSLLGRSFTADVRLDDGRISEAHAFVSLRAGLLVLLPLRGRLRLDDRDVSRVDLQPGQRIELAPSLCLDVLAVDLPDTMLAVALGDGPEQVLTGVTSLVLTPTPHLESGHHPQATALLWSDGLTWRVQRTGLPPRALRGGDSVSFEGVVLRARDVPSTASGVPETSPRAPQAPRTFVRSQYDSVQVWTDGMTTPLVLKGQQARLIAELLSLGGPARWNVVAGQLWPEEQDRLVLRHRLDVALAKIRRHFDGVGIRRDLVFSHNNGQLELLLYPGDRAEDLA